MLENEQHRKIIYKLRLIETELMNILHKEVGEGENAIDHPLYATYERIRVCIRETMIELKYISRN